MIPITPPQVTPAIAASFDIMLPTMPRAFNVLEGITRGQIIVDDPVRPTWAAVRETAFGTLYLGGRVTAALLELLAEHFRQTGDVGLGCWLDSDLNDILPPNPDYDGRTLYFTEHTPLHRGLLTIPLPDGYSIAPRDANLLEPVMHFTRRERWF